MVWIVAFFGVYRAHWTGVGSSVCGGRSLLCGGEVLLILSAFITLILRHRWKIAPMCSFKSDERKFFIEQISLSSVKLKSIV